MAKLRGMRRSLAVLLAALLVVALAPVAHPETVTFPLVRVRVGSQADASYLLSNFDETHNHKDGFVELLLWPGDAARLDARGFDYEVVEDDVLGRDLVARRGPQPTIELPGPDRSDYRRLPDYIEEMKALAKENRSIVELLKLPKETLEGRRVFGLEIAAGGNDGRPTFYVDGIHHAREWPAAEYPMIFAHHLVESFGKDRRITEVLKNLRVVIVPIVNPDGFDYSRESLVDAQGAASLPLAILGVEAYWRKNRRSFSGATVPVMQKNPDAYGVDPNRNYGYEWGDNGGGSSGSHINQTYRGNRPFSEPETRNVRHEILSRNVTGVLTNHTYGRLVLRPWGHTAADPPDEEVLASLGQKMADAMGGYTNQKGIGLYATTGTTDDWAYAAMGALGYTFEHGTAFHPPYADGVGQDFKGVMEAFLIMAEAAANPRLHSVIEGRVVDENGKPVKAKLQLFKSFKTPLGDGNPAEKKAIREELSMSLRSDGDGSFAWHVNPSTRPIPELEGKKESYELLITSRTGMRFLDVTVDRGERLDLGTIRLKRGGVIEVVGIELEGGS